MERNDYLKMLVEEMHSTTMATIGADGHPQTRVIDMMLWDKKGVYFLTAKGKAFYAQLMEQGYVAISATKDKKAVSLRGRIQNIHSEKLDEIFGKNPYMQKIYPGDTRAALEVFCVYEAEGEYFDISDPSHIVRDTILIGGAEQSMVGTRWETNALAASSVFQSVRRNASTSPASRPSSTSTSACTAADARRRVREERFAKEGSSPLILATDFMGIVIR